MTLKERIENNLTLFTLGLLFSGFVTGFTANEFIVSTIDPSTRNETECKQEVWQAKARQEAWGPANECPAFTLDAKITSPGDGALINFNTSYSDRLEGPILISTNRPLPKQSNIGIIIKSSDSPNFSVVFPSFYTASNGSTFRMEHWANLPFRLQSGISLELRPLVADDKRKIGVQFTSIQQIKNIDPSVFIGESVFLEKISLGSST